MQEIKQQVFNKEFIYRTIFGTDTKAGLLFDKYLLIAIVASVIIVCLDSIEEFHQHYGNILLFAEWFLTLLFAFEYVVRIYSTPNKYFYITSFFGIIDLVSLLPSVLSLFFPTAHMLLIVRALRLLRVFRVLKLRQYLTQANFLLTALNGSRQKITVFMLTIFSLMMVFGTLMYVIEGPQSGFTSIPKSVYWAIVTMTTVGFGDITPQTVIGQFIASLVMITGYCVLAVPTGIFTAELTTAMRAADKIDIMCLGCLKKTHEINASFCSHCGHSLYNKDEIEK